MKNKMIIMGLGFVGLIGAVTAYADDSVNVFGSAAQVSVLNAPTPAYDFDAIAAENERRAQSLGMQPIPHSDAAQRTGSSMSSSGLTRGPIDSRFRGNDIREGAPSYRVLTVEQPTTPLSCPQQGRYEYTGPTRPGLQAGMCIDCETQEFIENNGRCLRHT